MQGMRKGNGGKREREGEKLLTKERRDGGRKRNGNRWREGDEGEVEEEDEEKEEKMEGEEKMREERTWAGGRGNNGKE